VTWYFLGVVFLPVGTTTIICVTEGLHRSRGAGMVSNHMRRDCTEAFVLGSSRCHVCVLQTEAPYSPSSRCLKCEGEYAEFQVRWILERGRNFLRWVCKIGRAFLMIVSVCFALESWSKGKGVDSSKRGELTIQCAGLSP
jgi:hypothetical protein